ncbi:protein ANTI-SILENCING 1-like isoform X2 [Actinidia eriantha]|uniref:protein ANTI-SILENCING 1-like isoform X2 n=1 Tax=Actinidia eriantha TaxID=165200 RepID=UPI00258C7132|nr:protein ANTI-SILENCING 1-like isoform X2 [Actinidia eriantha]
MSHLVEVDKGENLEFNWGKKRGVGGNKKEVQFYESFAYDGVDYMLHDCVYMYKEGEPEPYIGKLIKIWENADKTKKVKVHWFFHPSEILNYFGDEEALQNEIFLASGEGVGVSNVNPLEAIAGKCNVICISSDSRNPQPSEQELAMADYVFYRTFDVKHHTISDRMEDKVAGLEVKFIFNRKESEQTGENPTVEFKTARADGNANNLMEKGSEDMKGLLVQHKFLPGGKPASGAALESGAVAATSGQQGAVSGVKTDSNKRETEKSKLRDCRIVVEDKAKFTNASDRKPTKKSMAGMKALGTTSAPSERKLKLGSGKDILESDKGVKSDKDALEDRPSKKPRIDSSVKPEKKKNDDVHKLSINSDGNNAKDLAVTLTVGGKTKPEAVSLGPDKDRKQTTDEKMRKLSNGKLLKVSAQDSPSEDRKTEGGGFEVTRRPNDERSKWFRPLPWEERMKSAHEQGTLVHLSNLDPEYTSGEVEDIIWNAFKENCTARMIQRTAISNRHSGQAFIILKTRAAAERIIKELEDRCLMLPNGSPIVGSSAPPPFQEKKSTFVGHLCIDKIKQQTQREMREAVSTSHCSQPNTIEYEMAMEWCVLQSRSERWWKQIYMQQGVELRKLKANLKLNISTLLFQEMASSLLQSPPICGGFFLHGFRKRRGLRCHSIY